MKRCRLPARTRSMCSGILRVSASKGLFILLEIPAIIVEELHELGGNFFCTRLTIYAVELVGIGLKVEKLIVIDRSIVDTKTRSEAGFNIGTIEMDELITVGSHAIVTTHHVPCRIVVGVIVD